MTKTVDGKCPAGHAYLLMGDGRLYCSHQSHDGRPTTHPLGFLPRTPAFHSEPVSAGPPAADASPVRSRARSVPPAGRARTPVTRRGDDTASAAASSPLPVLGLLFPGDDASTG